MFLFLLLGCTVGSSTGMENDSNCYGVPGGDSLQKLTTAPILTLASLEKDCRSCPLCAGLLCLPDRPGPSGNWLVGLVKEFLAPEGEGARLSLGAG